MVAQVFEHIQSEDSERKEKLKKLHRFVNNFYEIFQVTQLVSILFRTITSESRLSNEEYQASWEKLKKIISSENSVGLKTNIEKLLDLSLKLQELNRKIPIIRDQIDNNIPVELPEFNELIDFDELIAEAVQVKQEIYSLGGPQMILTIINPWVSKNGLKSLVEKFNNG